MKNMFASYAIINQVLIYFQYIGYSGMYYTRSVDCFTIMIDHVMCIVYVRNSHIVFDFTFEIFVKVIFRHQNSRSTPKSYISFI